VVPGFSTAMLIDVLLVLQLKLVLSAYCTSIVLIQTSLKLLRFSDWGPGTTRIPLVGDRT